MAPMTSAPQVTDNTIVYASIVAFLEAQGMDAAVKSLKKDLIKKKLVISDIKPVDLVQAIAGIAQKSAVKEDSSDDDSSDFSSDSDSSSSESDADEEKPAAKTAVDIKKPAGPAKKGDDASSDSDSSSSDDSSSSSDSDDSDVERKKAGPKPADDAVSDTSSESSDSESEQEVEAVAVAVAAKTVSAKKKAAVKVDQSDVKKVVVAAAAADKKKTTKAAESSSDDDSSSDSSSSASSSSSDSDSSSSDSESEAEAKAEAAKKKPVITAPSTPVPKTVEKAEKRKVAGTPEQSASKKNKTEVPTPPSSVKNGNSAERFRRVKEEEVEFVDDRLKDNTFLSKPGSDNSYGFKAHQDLIVTRGKGFTKEKNKKKKGSYRGGAIDMGSHSVKFQYSEEE